MLRVLGWLTRRMSKRPIAALALSIGAAAGQLHAADMTTPARPYGALRPTVGQYSGSQAYGQSKYAPYAGGPRTPAFGAQNYNQQQYFQIPSRGASPYSFAGTPLASTPPAAAAPPTAPIPTRPATITTSLDNESSELRRVVPLPATKPASATSTSTASAVSPATALQPAPFAPASQPMFGYAPSPYFGGIYSPFGPPAGNPFAAPAAPPRRQGSSLNSLVSFDNNLVQMDQLEPLPGDEPRIAQNDQDDAAGAPEGVSGSTPADQVFGVAPESNTLQFLRAQSVLLEPGERQFDIGFEYAITESLPLVIIDIPPPEAFNIRARERLMLIPFELRYGVTENVQAFCAVPFGWANTEVAFLGLDEFSNQVGIGDTNFGASILLCDGGGNAADVITTLTCTAPTGPTDFPFISATPFSQLGEGYWAAAASLLCIKNYDPIVVFYGFGYRHRFDATFDTAVGDFGVDPGEQFIYQFGVGFAANETVTLSCNFVGLYVTEDYIDDPRVPGGAVRVQGGIQEPMQLRFAITCARECKIVEPFVAVGLTDDAPSARFGITWTY